MLANLGEVCPHRFRTPETSKPCPYFTKISSPLSDIVAQGVLP